MTKQNEIENETIKDIAAVQGGARAATESQAIYAALIAGAVGFVVGLVAFFERQVPIFDRGISLGSVVAILGGVVALLTYLIVGSKRGEKSKNPWQFITTHIDTWALALVHGLLVFLAGAVLFYIVGRSFIGVTLDMWAASVLTALAAGATGYAVYLSAKHMNAVMVSALLAMFLMSGTFVSMLTAGDPGWWYYHFSSLGAGGGVSGYAFNATLIIAGLVVVALTKYIGDDLARLDAKKTKWSTARYRTFEVLLATMGVALALVGAFTYDAFPAIHNTAAGGMAMLFLVIVLALPWLTPQFQKAYFVASYLLLGGLLASVWLFADVGYFNLTVFELMAFALIFTWLVVFVRHLAALLEDSQPGAV